MIRTFVSFGLVALTVAALAGCSQEVQTGEGGKIVIGVIAKSQSNPVFQAARAGAEDKARELSRTLGRPVEIQWRTPNQEDAQKQADAVEKLAAQGVHGIAISCSDASKVTGALADAIRNKNVVVVCFDSDAPASGRMAYFGTDDRSCGIQVMRELVGLMGGTGKVAILAGNQTAPNLQARVAGVREEAARHPGIEIVDAYYHKETPQDAVAKVEQVQGSNPEIAGWAMVGGWPLFTDNAIKWAPGAVKVVAVDALPSQLKYLESGHVQLLLAQQVYEWGARSVEMIVDRIVHGKRPPVEREIAPLLPITADQAAAYAKNWQKWLPNR
ncbi:MAG: substrate-binding domain-containing protein [Planctomycetes bacterium]|nr:substrate-binding domain-containing protein [Planctomycetota bacterium]